MDRQQSSSLWIESRPDDLPPIRRDEIQQEADGPSHWLVIRFSRSLPAQSGLLADQAGPQAHRPGRASAVRPACQSRLPERPAGREKGAQQHMRDRRGRHAHVARTPRRHRAEDFLDSLDLPILAYLRETQVYVNRRLRGEIPVRPAHHIANASSNNGNTCRNGWRGINNTSYLKRAIHQSLAPTLNCITRRPGSNIPPRRAFQPLPLRLSASPNFSVTSSFQNPGGKVRGRAQQPAERRKPVHQ